MTMHAKIHAARELPHWAVRPMSLHEEIHHADCACAACQAFAPAVQPVRRALTINEISAIVIAAAIVGSAIAFAIDPHGAWAALVDAFSILGRR